MNVLIIGAGGREHALGWKIKQSDQCDQLFFAPGNAGTAAIGSNLAIGVNDFEALKAVILTNSVQLVVVGPEDPLVRGIVDFLDDDPELKNCIIIGPGKKGAQLEGSKEFSKNFMQRHQIPTAAAATFTKSSFDAGKEFLESLKPPFVLKADGLAAGKGVIITEDLGEAKDSLEDMLLNSKFGAASDKVLIEEFLSGIELSVFVLTDGKEYLILPEAKDYKRIGEGDQGPNTGGMGAISPVPFAQGNFLRKVEEKVVIPTIKGLAEESIPYCGFIFIGLMNVGGEPYVIEYNVRMGDPETEVVLPRIKNDFIDLLVAAGSGKLGDHQVEIDPRNATTVMLVSGGYPGSYSTGKLISGLEKQHEAIIFHAGTKLEQDQIVTNGGRVIACTGLGDGLQKALDRSYQAAEAIRWEGKNFRKDIGFDLQ